LRRNHALARSHCIILSAVAVSQAAQSEASIRWVSDPDSGLWRTGGQSPGSARSPARHEAWAAAASTAGDNSAADGLGVDGVFGLSSDGDEEDFEAAAARAQIEARKREEHFVRAAVSRTEEAFRCDPSMCLTSLHNAERFWLIFSDSNLIIYFILLLAALFKNF